MNKAARLLNYQFGHVDETVPGLPVRWGRRAYAELRKAQGGVIGSKTAAWSELVDLLESIIEGPTGLPVDATDAQIIFTAQQYAEECATVAAMKGASDEGKTESAAVRQLLAGICALHGVDIPNKKLNDVAAVRRCCDPAWWRRKLRRAHGRAAEYAALRLGFVSKQSGSYVSEETAERRVGQIKRNRRTLENTSMTNEEGVIYTLAQLAETGVGNLSVRRKEFMMRLAGCEQVSKELGHAGLFVTLTAPSKYHAVLAESGKQNPKYNFASPVQTQEYLNNVWALTRAQNGRDGIAPYGFRVAEPHHDGCPHWHMILFMPKDRIEDFKENLAAYALAVDGDEPGAGKSRVKFETINPARGGAAAYMAKYVSKNIGDGVLKEDLNGKVIITTPMRVDAWAGAWCIRQFQPIGQPPVTVWRELRRVPDAQVIEAPEHVKAAHAACQRVVDKDQLDENGKPVVIHAANWAEYVNAQGGINCGRDYRIAMSMPLAEVQGRYGLAKMPKPVGVYCKADPDAVYKSVRYVWTRSGAVASLHWSCMEIAIAKQKAEQLESARGVDFDLPWSPVNNCTRAVEPFWAEGVRDVSEIELKEPERWFGTPEAESCTFYPEEIEQMIAAQKITAGFKKANTVWTN